MPQLDTQDNQIITISFGQFNEALTDFLLKNNYEISPNATMTPELLVTTLSALSTASNVLQITISKSVNAGE